ncbi:MAG: aminodeoxychorismate lyase [Gammaproteobacteria bacterium]
MLLAAIVDGQRVSGLPLDDRGLAYGDGLFETMRVVGGRVPLLELHLARLQHGAHRLRLVLDGPVLQRELVHFLRAIADEGVADFTLKIIVTRGSAGRGYFPVDNAVARRMLLAFPVAAFPAGRADEGIRLFDCAMRLGINPVLAGLKHLNRLEQVLARGEWDDPAFAEGLLCDVEGRVVEGTMTNLFVVKDGELVTPALQRCGVAGVMRAWLIDRAGMLQWRVVERDLSRAELDAADEVFVCNSNVGIWPVSCVGERCWVPGPVTRRLQREVDRLWEA